MCESAINAAKMLKTLDEQREMFLWKYRDVPRNEVLELFKVHHFVDSRNSCNDIELMSLVICSLFDFITIGLTCLFRRAGV